MIADAVAIVFSHVGILVSWYAAIHQSFPYYFEIVNGFSRSLLRMSLQNCRKLIFEFYLFFG